MSTPVVVPHSVPWFRARPSPAHGARSLLHRLFRLSPRGGSALSTNWKTLIVGHASAFRGLPAAPCEAGDKKTIACPTSTQLAHLFHNDH